MMSFLYGKPALTDTNHLTVYLDSIEANISNDATCYIYFSIAHSATPTVASVFSSNPECVLFFQCMLLSEYPYADLHYNSLRNALSKCDTCRDGFKFIRAKQVKFLS